MIDFDAWFASEHPETNALADAQDWAAIGNRYAARTAWNAAIALMRGQSYGRVAAGWFVCVNGIAVSEAFDTRQKAEAELASSARFCNDLYAEPCYVSGAYVSLPKDTADEQ